jgi:hypothetical protein
MGQADQDPRSGSSRNPIEFCWEEAKWRRNYGDFGGQVSVLKSLSIQ